MKRTNDYDHPSYSDRRLAADSAKIPLVVGLIVVLAFPLTVQVNFGHACWLAFTLWLERWRHNGQFRTRQRAYQAKQRHMAARKCPAEAGTPLAYMSDGCVTYCGTDGRVSYYEGPGPF